MQDWFIAIMVGDGYYCFAIDYQLDMFDVSSR